jgi:hypothetical protein
MRHRQNSLAAMFNLADKGRMRAGDNPAAANRNFDTVVRH